MPTDRSPVTWTAAQVLADVRRKASLPATSTDWTDAVILREATDVLWSFAGWALSQGGEGRMLDAIDRPVTSALVGDVGAREWFMPPLAVAGTLESVTWTDTTGQSQSRLTRMDPSEEATWNSPTETGSPATYTVVGDRIRITPIPVNGGVLRITYTRRQPELVLDTAANVGTLTSIASASTTTTTLTMATVTLTGLSTGDTVDVIRATHPYAPILASAEITQAPAGTAIVVDQAVGMLAGTDYVGARVVRAGQSPYVHLPMELRAAFTEKVTANILRIMGDLQGMQACEAAAGLELARCLTLLSPRSRRDKPYAINPYSHLRMRMTRGRW